MQALEQVLQHIKQAPDMDLESMLMDILENETAIGLNEEELLSEDTCKKASSTVQVIEKPATVNGQRSWTLCC